jgi:hypothetical protein
MRMIRNLKVLGLATMAVLAVSAVAASAASAQANGTLTSTGNVTLKGTEIAGKSNSLTFVLAVECPGSTYTGHKYNVTPHTFIPNDVSTITITPHYKQPCKSGVGPSTVDLNGCDYVIHIGPTTATADQYSATYDIVCPEGKDITVTNWFSSAEHTENKEACVIHIAPQTGLAGGTIDDNTNGTTTLTGPVKVNAVETKDNLHPLLCPAKSGVAELDLNVLVKGFNEAGAETSISITHL